MHTHERRQMIRRMLESGPVPNQQSFVDAVSNAGERIAQATISRDLRALGVLKGPQGYTLPGQAAAPTPPTSIATVDMVRDVIHAGQLVIVHTLDGHANAVAVQIDAARLDGLVGTIAGDDTIFLAAANESTAASLCQDVASMFHQRPLPTTNGAP